MLQNRTELLEKVDHGSRSELLDYRYAQEKEEAQLLRHDPEVYVCPFLAYAPARQQEKKRNKRALCRIHPSLTGEKRSQDASFYGSAICQAYDCPNKSEPDAPAYSFLLERHFASQEHAYGRLMADSAFYHFIKQLGPEILEALRRKTRRRDRASSPLADFLALAGKRLDFLRRHGITSFGIALPANTALHQKLEILFGETKPCALSRLQEHARSLQDFHSAAKDQNA